MNFKHKIVSKSDKFNNKQRKLTDIFLNENSNVVQPPKQNDKFILARRLILWFCRDLLPFTLVDSRGFADFWKYMLKDIELPSKTTLAVSALDDIYICMKNRLTENLKESPKHATITFDLWTDNYRKISYITYTYHYVDDNWSFQNLVLKTSMMNHPHTSQRLKDDFEKTLNEFCIADKNIMCVTDGGKNIVKCTELMKLRRIGCIAHKCHRLIQKDLIEDPEMKAILDLIGKLRRVQSKLLYRYQELKQIHEDDRQKRIFELLEEFTQNEDIFEANERIDFDIIDDNSNFSGLKSMSNVRWNCIFKLAKCHLNHQSKILITFKIRFNYLSDI